MTDLRFHLDGYSLRNFSSRSVIEPPLLPRVKELSEYLFRAVMAHHKQCQDKLLPDLVKEITRSGINKEFELNIENRDGPLLFEREPIRFQYPIIHTLPDSECN